MTRSPCILYIGTDTTTRTALDDRLGPDRTRSVDTVAAAREQIEFDRYDCIVCEDTTDGALDLLRAVRERDGRPFLLFAVDPSEEDVRRALDAGVTDVVRRDGRAAPLLLAHRVAACLPGRDGAGPVGEEIEGFERITDAFFSLDREGQFTYVNESAADLLGRTPADLLGERVLEAFPESVGTPFQTECERAVETGEPVTFEEYYPPLDAWFSVRAYPSPSGLSIYFRDVTERKEHERTLELYERIIETVEDGVYVLDPEGRFMLVNEAFARMTGRSKEALLGAPASLVRSDRTGIVADEMVEEMLEGDRDASTVVTDLYTADGGSVPVEVRFAPFPTGDGRYGRVGIAWDITEHKRLEEALRTEKEQLRVAVETADIAAARVDRDLRYTWVHNPLPLFEGRTVVGKRAEDLFPPAEAAALTAIKRRVLETGSGTHRELSLAFPNGVRTFDLTAEPLTDEDGEVVGVATAALDITGRKRRETQLAALSDAASDLLRTDRPADVAAVAVETAVEGLALPVAMVASLDDASASLRPVARSEAVRDLDAVLDPDRGIAWEAFVANETTVGEVETAADGTAYRLVAVPLGEHGVLVVGTADTTATDGSDGSAGDGFESVVAPNTEASFVRILAANVESALDRGDRERRLRDRETELREQNAALERANRANDVIRQIDRALVAATTRDGIERTVCSRLTGAGPYVFAWVGEYDAVSGSVTATQRAGEGADYLDHVDPGAVDPVAGAVRDRTPAVVEDVLGGPPLPPWRREAARRGFRSLIAVPIVYHDVVYGVLCVYAADREAFGSLERTVLAELGETIGYAINAVETKRALLSDTVVELEFDVSDPGIAFVDWSADLDCIVRFGSAVTHGDGSITVFFEAEGVGPGALIEAAGESLAVDDVRLLDERGDHFLFEATLAGDGFVGTLLDHGAVPRTIRAEGGRARVLVTLHGEADVRAFVGTLKTRYPTTELVARREVDRPVETVHGFRAEVEAALTDRQREVLRTAFFSGYFNSPRTRTGGEIGDALGISQPTFTAHLRSAQRKIFHLLFGDGTLDN